MSTPFTPPDSWCCPITGEVFSDPVITPNGVTFERSAIEQWISTKHSCPVTRAPLAKRDLIPNRGLKAVIDEKRAALAAAGTPLDDPAPARTTGGSGTGSGVGAGGKTEEAATPAAAAAAAPTPAARPGEFDLSVTAAMAGVRGDDVEVMVRVVPPTGRRRSPADVVCVVDVSGSMCSAASAAGVEDAGLSLLDIVKHAVRTVIHIMGDGDRLSVVSYSSTATVVLPLTKMDDRGRQKALSAVTSLRAGGQTNLWDGLHSGLEVVREAAAAGGGSGANGRIASVLLLTDGCPTVTPPRGHLAMLQRYKDTHSKLDCTINTFGFGYSLDSHLLDELATEGDGMYCFIPDSGFVGTAFVHAVANVLSTAATHAQLSLELPRGAKLVPVGEGKAEEEEGGGALALTHTSWGVVRRIGTLSYGQSKDTVVRLRVPAGSDWQRTLSATLTFSKLSGDKVTLTADGAVSVAAGSSDADAITAQRLRCDFVNTITNALGMVRETRDLRDVQRVVAGLTAAIKASGLAGSSPAVKGLHADAAGQVTEAVSRDKYFKKWVRHYLPSLRRAHALQQCNNFKDPGVQVYGGTLFASLRDAGDALFVKLPPPEPSRAAPVRRLSSAAGSSVGGGGGGGGGGGRRRSRARAAAPRRVSMSRYHNAGAGCIDGACTAHLADGGSKPVAEVRAGDRLATPDGAGAVVVCVMRTAFPSGSTKLCRIPGGGPALTPYHPVQVDGRWTFPIDLAPMKAQPCPAVYNWVLEVGATCAVVDGVPCITLGHGIKGDSVAEHAYFGTQAVVDDLRRMRGWDDGMVELSHGCTRRDAATGLVCGMSQA